MTTTLQYRSFVMVEDLALNECTVRRTGNDAGTEWWMLWFYVARETDGQPEAFAAPVAPGGTYTENGPGGRTWGLTETALGTWQIAPSINVLDTRELHPSPHPTQGSLWHQTPAIVGVPNGEAWMTP